MRVPGYCTKCHKVKPVQVSGNALALASSRGGAVQGICSACEDAAKEKRSSMTPRR